MTAEPVSAILHIVQRVIIESPFAGDTEANLTYLRRCLRDSLLRGEAPYASHALYAQSGVLDDGVPEERKRGMEAGFAWGRVANLVAVYGDLGVSDGMREGIRQAQRRGLPVVFRFLDSDRQVSGWEFDVNAAVDLCPYCDTAAKLLDDEFYRYLWCPGCGAETTSDSNRPLTLRTGAAIWQLDLNYLACGAGDEGKFERIRQRLRALRHPLFGRFPNFLG